MEIKCYNSWGFKIHNPDEYRLFRPCLCFQYEASKLSAGTDWSQEHPKVDYTPPAYISLLFTDLGILTPSAVSDELIKLYLWQTCDWTLKILLCTVYYFLWIKHLLHFTLFVSLEIAMLAIKLAWFSKLSQSGLVSPIIISDWNLQLKIIWLVWSHYNREIFRNIDFKKLDAKLIVETSCKWKRNIFLINLLKFLSGIDLL